VLGINIMCPSEATLHCIVLYCIVLYCIVAADCCFGDLAL